MASFDAVEKAYFKAVAEEKVAARNLVLALVDADVSQAKRTYLISLMVKLQHASNHRGFMGCMRGRLSMHAESQKDN